jgi:aspartyl-tRNA(Asn)/glutamyl-tRNA(Gln) amidotransferase subunit C
VKITEQEVRYVAGLANLNLSDAEVARFQGDLDQILEHIGKLNELDTGIAAPMSQVLYEALGNQAALANAPDSGAGYFKVPQVIER